MDYNSYLTKANDTNEKLTWIAMSPDKVYVLAIDASDNFYVMTRNGVLSAPYWSAKRDYKLMGMREDLLKAGAKLHNDKTMHTHTMTDMGREWLNQLTHLVEHMKAVSAALEDEDDEDDENGSEIEDDPEVTESYDYENPFDEDDYEEIG